ncbi:MAG: PAS domain-containing sensor histidine kinase [Candidatus Binatia bacterium]
MRLSDPRVLGAGPLHLRAGAALDPGSEAITALWRTYDRQTAATVCAQLPWAAVMFLVTYAVVAIFEVGMYPDRWRAYLGIYLVGAFWCALAVAITRSPTASPTRCLVVTLLLGVGLITNTSFYHVAVRGEAEVLALGNLYLMIGFLAAFPWGGWPQLVVGLAACAGLAGGLLTTVSASVNSGILLSGMISLAGLSVAAAVMTDRSRRSLFLTQESLRESEERFRAVVHNATDLIFLDEGSGVLRYVSPSIETILGYPPSAVVGRNVQEFIHPDDRAANVAALASAMSRPGKTVSVCYRARHADGRWIDLEATGTNLVDDPAIRGIVGTARDISQRTRIERELTAAKEAAEAASHARRDFVASVSHDLRTPVNIIFGMADMALDTAVTADQRELVETIKRAAGQLHALLNDLLDFSKMDAGVVDLAPRRFLLRAWLGSTLEPLGREAAAKPVRLIEEIGEGVPEAIVADPDRLRQVLVNLVGNAVKFTDAGRVTVRIELDHGNAPPALRVTIADTGVGIVPAEMARLFQPFAQAAATTRSHGGTGLGLAICKRLVEQMGGAIGAESEPGRGSTFWFTIPLT